MDQITIPSGLLACFLLIPLRGQEAGQKQVVIGHRGRWVMKISVTWFIILAALICASCKKSVQSSKSTDSRHPELNLRTIGTVHAGAAEDALDIPIILTFVTTFPDNVSMFLSRTKDTATWSTKALLYGRHVLDIRVPVKDDGNGKMIQASGPVEFHIVEVSEVSGRSIRYEPNQLHFGIKEWEQLMNANFDFSAIGYTIEKRKPVPDLQNVFYGA